MDVEALIETWRTLYANVEQSKTIEGQKFLLPGNVGLYENLLKDVSIAYSGLS